jgi:exonuclease III
MPTIATWNSRGNPKNNKEKEKMLASLLDKHDFILLQECGGLEIDVDGYYFCGVDQAGAFNNRCSTCIISKHEISNPKFYANSSSGRSLLVVTCGMYAIATIHADAGNAGAWDVRSALKTLLDNHEGSSIILGGDFNVEPENIEATRNTLELGTQSRPLTMNWKATDLPTYIGTDSNPPKRLDYFIYSSGISLNNLNRMLTPAESDHYPVFAEF